MTDDLKLALSIPEFCRAVGISRRSYYSLQEHDQGPPVVRIGGRVVIPIEGAKAWLRSRQQGV